MSEEKAKKAAAPKAEKPVKAEKPAVEKKAPVAPKAEKPVKAPKVEAPAVETKPEAPVATEEKKPFVKKEFNKDRAPRAEGDRPKFAKGKGGGKGKKRVCFYCAEQKEVDYREFQVLRKFLAENAKILPRRQTGVCAKHQRKLTTAIKTARQMSLLPYVIE